jgi:dTDP-glucose pyrophosphorylase
MEQRDQGWRNAVLPATSTVGEAIQNLNEVGIRIVLIADETGILEGTISDGDIRRGLLKGLDLASPVTEIIRHDPLVVRTDLGRNFVLQLMEANKIQQIPVVDDKFHLVGLHLWDEINTLPERPNQMVIMAGGKGTRLYPRTESCPKALLPLAGKPMLEHIINRARLEGFFHFTLAIYHLGQMIEDHFGNGERLGVEIEYVREDSPLGTAGALKLLNPAPAVPFVVTNCDVITDIRYGDLLDFHSRYEASATMAVRVHQWQHPFGVVQTQGMEIVGFEEKPIARSHINAGVYVLDPRVLDFMTQDLRCDMPELFERLHAEGKKTIAYPMHEPWLDVGRPDDLEKAETKVKFE